MAVPTVIPAPQSPPVGTYASAVKGASHITEASTSANPATVTTIDPATVTTINPVTDTNADIEAGELTDIAGKIIDIPVHTRVDDEQQTSAVVPCDNVTADVGDADNDQDDDVDDDDDNVDQADDQHNGDDEDKADDDDVFEDAQPHHDVSSFTGKQEHSDDSTSDSSDSSVLYHQKKGKIIGEALAALNLPPDPPPPPTLPRAVEIQTQLIPRT